MRKTVLTLFVVLLLASPAWAAPALVQHKCAYNGGGVSTVVVVLDSTVTAGNLLTAGIAEYSSLQTINSVTSSPSNSFTIANTAGITSLSASAYAANVAAGSTTVTANLAGNAYAGMCVQEWSGIATASPLDTSAAQEQTAPGTGTNALTSGNITTTVSGTLIWGWSTTQNFLGAITAGTGFTSQNSAALDPLSRPEYKIAGVAGTYNATATTDTGTNPYVTYVMAFKPLTSATRVRHRISQ